MTQGVLHLMTGDEDAPDASHPRRGARRRATRWHCPVLRLGEGNDPYAEHDFGAFDHLGERLFFKIDLYEDDSVKAKNDPHAVRIVLTIMLAEEY